MTGNKKYLSFILFYPFLYQDGVPVMFHGTFPSILSRCTPDIIRSISGGHSSVSRSFTALYDMDDKSMEGTMLSWSLEDIRSPNLYSNKVRLFRFPSILSTGIPNMCRSNLPGYFSISP